MSASMLDGGAPGAVQDTAEGDALRFGEESGKSFHASIVSPMQGRRQRLPKYFL